MTRNLFCASANSMPQASIRGSELDNRASDRFASGSPAGREDSEVLKGLASQSKETGYYLESPSDPLQMVGHYPKYFGSWTHY